jgi:uncharacterized protein (DUF1501 family)
MERAAPGNRVAADGWHNRYLRLAGVGRPIAGVTLGKSKVKALQGTAPSLAFVRIAGFDVSGQWADERAAGLASRYELARDTPLGASMMDALETLDVIRAVPTGTTVTYPPSPLGGALADAAALIKADIGVQVLAIDTGGWDHHTATQHSMHEVGGDLAASLAAFQRDLGAHASTTLTLCMTEFGRRVAENGGDGTDHGHGGVMVALGGGIAGGRVLTRDGRWPGLAPDRLSKGEDLAVTTDFRDVFAEVLHRHLLLSIGEATDVLRGHDVDPARFPGLFA